MMDRWTQCLYPRTLNSRSAFKLGFPPSIQQESLSGKHRERGAHSPFSKIHNELTGPVKTNLLFTNNISGPCLFCSPE